MWPLAYWPPTSGGASHACQTGILSWEDHGTTWGIFRQFSSNFPWLPRGYIANILEVTPLLMIFTGQQNHVLWSGSFSRWQRHKSGLKTYRSHIYLSRVNCRLNTTLPSSQVGICVLGVGPVWNVFCSTFLAYTYNVYLYIYNVYIYNMCIYIYISLYFTTMGTVGLVAASIQWKLFLLWA